MNNSVPAVSVFCTAYNHEKYIGKALRSMIEQVTDFKYEIIVHDDASTDGTKNIIEQYYEEYPDTIVPIFQTENKYSRNIPIIRSIMLPISKGRYIAFCEGDDYWCDKYKLQKQFDIMEANPSYVMCTHAYGTVVANTEKLMYEVHSMENDGLLNARFIIDNQNPPHTSTFFMKRSVLTDAPDFFYNVGVGDYPYRVYSVLNGGIYYTDHMMSCYRRFADNSWTYTALNNGKLIEHSQRMISFVRQVDQYSNEKYHNSILKRIDYCEYLIHVAKGELFAASKTKYFKTLSIKKRLELYIEIKHPNMWKKILAIHSKGK